MLDRLYLVLGFFLVLVGCKNAQNSNEDQTVYFCDAEQTEVLEEGSHMFETNGQQFRGGEAQSADFAFDGVHSVKLTKSNQYGFSFSLQDVKKDEFFQVSVWEKEGETSGALVCTVTGDVNFILVSNQSEIYEHKNGWKRHFLQFKAITDFQKITFFTFIGDSGNETYFDHFEVKRFKKRPDVVQAGSSFIALNFPDSSRFLLDSAIADAVKEEIIRADFKSYVPAELVENLDTVPVEVRLKGDWTDHLISGAVSYRIKTGNDAAFHGLTSFSIQHPKTRNYLHEWFVHRWLDKEDLLSTYYDFLQVKSNDDYEGVYAIEEHFDKQLLESRNRREGPILKMDEAGFWALAVKAREMGLSNVKAPFYQAALMSCFKEKRTLKSENLKNQFLNGTILLTYFQQGYRNPELLFDMEKLAVFYALMDAANVRHALAWHNRRFYYNPVTAKIEHIGFDMAPMVRPLNPLISVERLAYDPDTLTSEECLDWHFFRDSTFRAVYTAKLVEISNVEFLDKLFAEMDSAILVNEKLMALEIPGFVFDRAIYYEKAASIRFELETLDEKWDAFLLKYEGIQLKVNGEKDEFMPADSSFFLKAISVNAYRSKWDSTRYQLQFENYHFSPITIYGYSVKGQKDTLIRFEKPIVLEGFTGGKIADSASIIVDQKPSRYFFELKNLPGKLRNKKFIKWEKLVSEHPRIELFKGFKSESPLYSIQGKNLTFKSGYHIVKELIYVPAGYVVHILPGTSFDFIQKGGLITNDNTFILGNENQKVKFNSSDGTGMGITILQADSVLVQHTDITNMNTLSYKGWVLTGAMTIYESLVLINNLTINDSNCEDGLNIIRSHFQIQNCHIENTKSDGFDADFCTGKFWNSTFKNTGNDCIDFSGSVVEIEGITIYNSGDKGVSAGERSQLTLRDIQIDGALTGVASKDGSTLIGQDLHVKNVEVGLATFQKKPEYGSSSIVLNQIVYSGIDQLCLIEKGSLAIVDGVRYYGTRKFDIDQMYLRFGEK